MLESVNGAGTLRTRKTASATFAHGKRVGRLRGCEAATRSPGLFADQLACRMLREGGDQLVAELYDDSPLSHCNDDRTRLPAVTQGDSRGSDR